MVMGHATDILGYTADADMYCVRCALELYGEDSQEPPYRQDGEGNDVHPIFNDGSAIDGNDHGKAVCGNCGDVIDQWCSLCESGDHGTIDHGDALVLLEHGRRNEWTELEDRLSIARDLVSTERARGIVAFAFADASLTAERDRILRDVADTLVSFGEASAELGSITRELLGFARRRDHLETLERDGKLPVTANADGSPLSDYQRTLSVTRFATAGECLSDEGCYEFLSESCRAIDDALGTAGYLAYDDGDVGCWFVYSPADGILRDYDRKDAR